MITIIDYLRMNFNIGLDRDSYASNYIQSCKRHNEMIDVDFIDWMNQIESFVKSITGLNLLDLPDEMYMINYEQGTTWQLMAYTVVNNYEANNPWIELEVKSM